MVGPEAALGLGPWVATVGGTGDDVAGIVTGGVGGVTVAVAPLVGVAGVVVMAGGLLGLPPVHDAEARAPMMAMTARVLRPTPEPGGLRSPDLLFLSMDMCIGTSAVHECQENRDGSTLSLAAQE